MTQLAPKVNRFHPPIGIHPNQASDIRRYEERQGKAVCFLIRLLEQESGEASLSAGTTRAESAWARGRKNCCWFRFPQESRSANPQ